MNKIVPSDANYKATLDASDEGSGEVWIPGTKALATIVWRIKWPDKVRRRLVTFANPTGDITKSDPEMSAEVLGWLVLEGILPNRWIHAGVCSNNSATVSQQTWGAPRRSRVVKQLLRILTIRLRKNIASPLVTCHLKGDQNALGNIQSQSYGYKAAWNLRNDTYFWTFFNEYFPLPSHNSWTGFRLDNKVVTKVMQELLTQVLSIDEWRQLPTLGRKYGNNGRITSSFSECIPT